MTNAQILNRAAVEIAMRGMDDPNYSIEQHIKDLELIAALTELKIKFK